MGESVSRRPSQRASVRPVLNVRASQPEHSLAVLDHCLLAVWREITVVGIQQVMRAVQQLRNENPDVKIAIISLVEADCNVPFPVDAVRAWSDMLKRNEHNIVRTSVIYGRDGFASATVRCQVMASNSDSKASIPHIVTPMLSEACSWTADGSPDGPAAAELAEALEHLRGRASRELQWAVS